MGKNKHKKNKQLTAEVIAAVDVINQSSAEPNLNKPLLPELPKPEPTVELQKPEELAAAPVPLTRSGTIDKVPNRRRKSEVSGPTKLVWDIADAMIEADLTTRRRDIIVECQKQGIAYYTIRTQVQQWHAAIQMSKKAAAEAPSGMVKTG